nr:hypothetical protein [Photorhabdus luminescens]
MEQLKNISQIEHQGTAVCGQLFGGGRVRINCLHFSTEKAEFDLRGSEMAILKQISS